MVDKNFKTANTNIFKKTEKSIKHEERNGSFFFFFFNELLDLKSIHLRFFKNTLDRINKRLTTVKERISEAEDKEK